MLFEIIAIDTNMKATFYILVASFFLAYMITFVFSEKKDFLLLIFFWGVSLIITFAITAEDSGLLFAIAIMMIVFSAYAKIKLNQKDDDE